MTWKVKEQYKGIQPNNINLPLDKLSQKQIEGLREHLRETYFEKKEKVKKAKTIKKRIEDL